MKSTAIGLSVGTFNFAFHIKLALQQNLKSMQTLEFNLPGELDIKPSQTSSKNDFDFLEGKWNIKNKKLRSRLTDSDEWIEFNATHEMRKVLTSIGNVENFCATIDGKLYEGMGVRLFNPSTKLWSIYWCDNNLGIMEKPVIGSFENNIGSFFCKDIFKDKEIIMQFQFDATNPDKPVWSQAFSADNGKTWEWNWYMYFSKSSGEDVHANLNHKISTTACDVGVNVIELRNYILKPGTRDNFINYFKRNFITSQNETGGYTPAQFRVKGAEDNFFWIRGFSDMESRSKFLPEFYYGPVWKEYGATANSMLVNNDNVYLLKPLTYHDGALHQGKPININKLTIDQGIAVIDFYIANSKLDKLISFLSSTYLPALKKVSVEDFTLWVTETAENDFPRLPVFQDRNLMVVIAYYKDELEYSSKRNAIDAVLSMEQKAELQDIVTTKSSLILYPA